MTVALGSVAAQCELAAGLSVLSDTQAVVSANDTMAVVLGNRPAAQQAAVLCTALHAEVQELFDKLGWKTWKRQPGIDTADIAGEFADILAFLGILVLWLKKLGINPGDLAAAYGDKSTTNYLRLRGKNKVDGDPASSDPGGYGVRHFFSSNMGVELTDEQATSIMHIVASKEDTP